MTLQFQKFVKIICFLFLGTNFFEIGLSKDKVPSVKGRYCSDIFISLFTAKI